MACVFLGTVMFLFFPDKIISLPANQQNVIEVGANWITINDVTVNGVDREEFIKTMKSCGGSKNEQ